MIQTFIHVIRVLHFSLLLLVLFGWLFSLTSDVAAIIHLVFIPSIIIHWKTNNDVCILTTIEQRLVGDRKDKKEHKGVFIKSLLARFFDPIPSERTIKIMMYFAIWSSWSASLYALIA